MQVVISRWRLGVADTGAERRRGCLAARLLTAAEGTRKKADQQAARPRTSRLFNQDSDHRPQTRPPAAGPERVSSVSVPVAVGSQKKQQVGFNQYLWSGFCSGGGGALQSCVIHWGHRICKSGILSCLWGFLCFSVIPVLACFTQTRLEWLTTMTEENRILPSDPRFLPEKDSFSKPFFSECHLPIPIFAGPDFLKNHNWMDASKKNK